SALNLSSSLKTTAIRLLQQPVGWLYLFSVATNIRAAGAKQPLVLLLAYGRSCTFEDTPSDFRSGETCDSSDNEGSSLRAMRVNHSFVTLCLCLCLVLLGTGANARSRDNAAPGLLSPDQGQALADFALRAGPNIDPKPDCSHLVHMLYTQA